MKIIFIHQAPHRLHAAWAKTITDKFYPCVPDFIFNKKKIYDFVYKHTILNQLLCLLQSFFVPKADVYLIEGIKSALPAIINKKKYSKIILINSDTFFYNYKMANSVMQFIYGKYLNYVDAMFSTSHFMKNMANKYSSVPNIVVYPFVDSKYLKVNANIYSKNIVFTGRLVKDKGLSEIIRAFVMTNSKYKDKLYLVGKVEENIKELKTPNNKIVVPGWVDDVEKYLSDSSIFINLATHESFGVSILEAMAAGNIPLITKNCGIKELIKPISKELICSRNPAEISSKIKDINSNILKKKQISQECKKIASQYTKKRSIREFKRKFNKLICEMKIRN